MTDTQMQDDDYDPWLEQEEPQQDSVSLLQPQLVKFKV